MVSAETKHPRIYLKTAFKAVYLDFGIFFIGGALCVGILITYNDPNLVTALTSGVSSGAASPCVIAMGNLGVEGLPHLANALMVTLVFSAGNTYFYCARRALHSLAVGGRDPHVFTRTNKGGALTTV